jgi:nuclear pore complex protein Nup62
LAKGNADCSPSHPLSYILASDLHTQLDDLSASLTQLIESVNGLGLQDKPSNEDPMAQIAQILSSHLESLQWIDGAIREVDGKVNDVEKRINTSGTAGAARARGFGIDR